MGERSRSKRVARTCIHTPNPLENTVGAPPPLPNPGGAGTAPRATAQGTPITTVVPRPISGGSQCPHTSSSTHICQHATFEATQKNKSKGKPLPSCPGSCRLVPCTHCVGHWGTIREGGAGLGKLGARGTCWSHCQGTSALVLGNRACVCAPPPALTIAPNHANCQQPAPWHASTLEQWQP